MIIYGTRNTELAKEQLFDACPNCGAQSSIAMHVFQTYAHVFWIPLFPAGKTGISQCHNCKQVLKLKELPVSLKTAYHNLKAQSKTPIWTFSGLAIIAILIAGGIVSDKKKDEKNAQLILAPRAGDIFEVRTENNHFTVLKVSQVEGDSVFVQQNIYEVNLLSGVDDLKKKEYSDDIWGISKSDLKEMLKKGDILNIDRQ